VHRAHAPDLFGTLFGATAELVRFRRALGYRLVRLGVSRGARSGEPSVVMVRPCSDRARSLVEALERELASNLPVQLELLRSDGGLGLDATLEQELRAGLGEPPPLDERELREVARSYLGGPRPFESAAFALEALVDARSSALAGLAPRERALIEGRVLRRRAWPEVAAEAGYPSVAASMRALRAALRALLGE
jgi:tRNA(Met) cytidine acetyltransferase